MDHMIDIAEPKAKLSNLAAHMPDADEFTCLFASALAMYLNPEMIPAGVDMSAKLLVHDLVRGRCGFSSIKVPVRLFGQSPVIYALLDMSIPSIVDATFPAEFASAFRALRAAS